MNKVSFAFCSLLLSLMLGGCTAKKQEGTPTDNNLERAQVTLDSLYRHYSAPGTNLLRENHPFDDKYTASYLASEEQAHIPNQYSYLWPYSGTLSAVSALLETTKDPKYITLIDERVLDGLENYFDRARTPHAYASYINTAPQSDRFYDDNVWLGIDFTDLYLETGNPRYLEQAELIWQFILSGMDSNLGGGIYWCEQKKGSKNTCSNAPGSVYAFKLFEATADSTYFHQGTSLYNWTKSHLQDPEDGLYFDNIKMDGKIGKAKYAYNSGQMMQSAALQYKLTNDAKFLEEAQRLAAACHAYFFSDYTTPEGDTFKLLKKGDVWFTAVMLRGFIELYKLDGNSTYMQAFGKNLDYAWQHSRQENGLFNVDFSGRNKETKKWLLTQAAMVEMYARMANIYRY